MKKLFTIGICISTMLSCNIASEPTYLLDRSSDRTTKVLAYEKFIKNCLNTRNNTEKYPDCYGGAYLSEEGDFIISITNLTQDNQAELSNLIEVDDITFVECEYSYNQLLEIKNIIDNYLVRNTRTDKLDNISSVYIDVQKNRVIVYLKSCLDSDIVTFNNEICTSNLIEFKEVEDVNIHNTHKANEILNNQTRAINVNLSTGDLLCDNHSNVDSLSYASVAYRAQHISGVNGFVTSAIVAKYYGDTVYSYDGLKTPVAMTMLSMQQDEVNAAFCQLTGATIDNNLLYNNAYFTYSTVAPPQPNAFMPGNTVLFYGANIMSSNNSLPISSSIYGVNCTVVGYNNITYTGLVMSRYLSQNGADCGGLVAGLYAIRQLRVFGIHLITIGVNSYFIPASTINQAFNLSIY